MFKRRFIRHCVYNIVIFRDWNGLAGIHGTIITVSSYSVTLQRLQWRIQNKRDDMLSSGIVLLQDNTWPHI
jgi:hypothetical protein